MANLKVHCVSCASCFCSVYPAQQPTMRQPGYQQNRIMKHYSTNQIFRLQMWSFFNLSPLCADIIYGGPALPCLSCFLPEERGRVNTRLHSECLVGQWPDRRGANLPYLGCQTAEQEQNWSFHTHLLVLLSIKCRTTNNIFMYPHCEFKSYRVCAKWLTFVCNTGDKWQRKPLFIHCLQGPQYCSPLSTCWRPSARASLRCM